MAAILDGQSVRILLTQYWSDFIQRLFRIVIFMVLPFLVMEADTHFELPSHINLKDSVCRLIPTVSDHNLFRVS